MSEYDMKLPDYVWIYNNWQDSEYASYSNRMFLYKLMTTYWAILRIQNTVKDLTCNALEK